MAWLLKLAQILGQPFVLPPLLTVIGLNADLPLSYAVARAVSLAVVPYVLPVLSLLIVPTTMDHALLL